MGRAKLVRKAVDWVADAAERLANAELFTAKSVVKEGGKPRRVYTGTSKDKDFTAFRVPRNGTWFAANPKVASEYALENDSMDLVPDPRGKNPWSMKRINEASRVIPAYVNIQNPMRYTNPSEMNDQLLRLAGDNYKRGQGLLFDQLRAKGHDGVILGDDEVFVVLREPGQIKSAIGNRGTYDPKEKDMNKARGGLAVKPIWDKKRPKDLGEPKSLSVKKKKSAKARAAAAGRPYPNLIDNMAAARKKGK